MIKTLFLFALLFFALPSHTYAVCPVCTVVVGTGLGVSRWIGIDDTVTGIWVGGLILSSGLWLGDWVKKKGWKISYPDFVSILIMVIFVIQPLYWSKMIGILGNTMWGVDKILLGTAIGSLVFLLGVGIDKWLRKINNGKVYVYYQKVIVPVFLLSIISFVFYLITI